MAQALWFWTTINSAQKLLIVQEKIACQYALEVQLFEKIARGNGHLTKRMLRIAELPVCENLACFRKLLFVQEIESRPKLRFGCEGRRVGFRHPAGKTDGWAQ